MHRRLVAVACALVALSACGDGHQSSQNGPVNIGAGVDLDSTSTTRTAVRASAVTSDDVAAPTQAAPTPTPEPAPAPTATRVANRSDREVDGWHLTLVVADRTTFGPADPIMFELSFTNVSASTRYTDAAQKLHFGLLTADGKYVWTDQSCGGAERDDPGETHAATPTEPHESGRFVGRYPISESAAAMGAPECRLAPGRYLAVGALDTCPRETLEEVSYKDNHGYLCHPDQERSLVSDPVPIEITAQ
ncbi:MAG: hypothetical protein QOD30_171 [Actinomycetota bacterium]|jgi:hypothetical protein|nr:hypothetical protein [Actinomycetota bacterium]